MAGMPVTEMRMVASTFMPGRSTTPSGKESKTIFTGMRSHHLDVVAGGVLRRQQAHARAGGAGDGIHACPRWCGRTCPRRFRLSGRRCTLASCVSLKLAVTQTSLSGMMASSAWPGCTIWPGSHRFLGDHAIDGRHDGGVARDSAPRLPGSRAPACTRAPADASLRGAHLHLPFAWPWIARPPPAFVAHGPARRPPRHARWLCLAPTTARDPGRPSIALRSLWRQPYRHRTAAGRSRPWPPADACAPGRPAPSRCWPAAAARFGSGDTPVRCVARATGASACAACASVSSAPPASGGAAVRWCRA